MAPNTKRKNTPMSTKNIWPDLPNDMELEPFRSEKWISSTQEQLDEANNEPELHPRVAEELRELEKRRMEYVLQRGLGNLSKFSPKHFTSLQNTNLQSTASDSYQMSQDHPLKGMILQGDSEWIKVRMAIDHVQDHTLDFSLSDVVDSRGEKLAENIMVPKEVTHHGTVCFRDNTGKLVIVAVTQGANLYYDRTNMPPMEEYLVEPWNKVSAVAPAHGKPRGVAGCEGCQLQDSSKKTPSLVAWTMVASTLVYGHTKDMVETRFISLPAAGVTTRHKTAEEDKIRPVRQARSDRDSRWKPSRSIVRPPFHSMSH